MSLRPLFIVCALLLLLAGCSSTTVKSTSFVPMEQETAVIPESQLLDVGVLNFDPGLDDANDEDTLRPEVRNAESRFFADQLTTTLQQSGAWGPVRVIPGRDTVVDLYVHGTILHSDGEQLELAVTAWDSSGRQWLDKTYKDVASSYTYDSKLKTGRDPFQGLFNQIANDLRQHRGALPAGRAEELRTISELRFAREFAPNAFADYLTENRNGELTISRLPAKGDPMLERLRRIRERDYLFVDTLQDYYTGFAHRMEQPYQRWRAENYEEVIATRELKKQSNARLAGGILAVVAGIAAAGASDGSASAGGFMAAAGGGMLIKNALEKRQEAQLHMEALAELGESLETDIEPHVIELEDRTITLTGNAEAQYAQWKEILRQIYQTEHGTF